MKTIGHRDYEALRTYSTDPAHVTVYRNGGHRASLLSAGYLAAERGGVVMTDAGRAALEAYRVRYGVSA